MRVKVLIAGVLLAGAAFAAGGCSTPAAASDTARNITGTWTVTVDPDGPPPAFQSTITFTSAGGVVEATSRAVASGGIGAWTRAGDGSFDVTFRKYRFDANGSFIGTTVIVENDVVDPSGTTYAGHATTKILDAGGNVQTSFTSTSHAERMS